MRKGTPEQLIAEITDKIEELKSTNSSTSICASDEYEYYVDTQGIFDAPGSKFSIEDVESLFYELKRMHDPVVERYRSFESWIKDTVENGYLDHVYDVEDSSRVIVDDKEDVIMADEDIEIKEIKEEIPVDVVEAPEDESEYFTGLYVNIEKELKDLTDSVAWSTDEDNVYLDVNFEDGHVFTFTIPKADLTHDVQQLDKDIEYVCTAVRGTKDSETDIESAKSCNSEFCAEKTIESSEDELDDNWEFLGLKDTESADGYAYYSLWHDVVNDRYVAVEENESPETSEPDFEFGSYDEAMDWFHGLED